MSFVSVPDYLEQRLVQLRAEREQALARVQSLTGAIEELETLRQKIAPMPVEEPPAVAEERPKGRRRQ